MEQEYRIGDCIEVLKGYPENHFDACVTDPPYGLEFMGKEWDTLRGWRTPENMGERRTSFGGYSVRTTPRFDTQTQQGREQYLFHRAWAIEVLRVLKPGGHILCFGGTRTFHRLTCALEDAGFEIRDCLCWLYGSGFPKSATSLKPAWEPVILARKPVDGTVAENVLKWGTGGLNIDGCRIETESRPFRVIDPKPEASGAVYAGRREAGHGFDGGSKAVGQTSLGRWPANLILAHHPDCRERGIKNVRGDGHYPSRRGVGPLYSGGWMVEENLPERQLRSETVPNWQCHQDCPIRILDEQTGESVSSPLKPYRRITHENYSGSWPDSHGGGYEDAGGASRFFYCAKASRGEREYGLEHLPLTDNWALRQDFTSDPRMDNPQNRFPVRNYHPTVKPIALMRWLVRLVTPPNGLILDPMCGTGTTLIAARLERFRGLGIEREAEYEPILKARLATDWRGFFAGDRPPRPTPRPRPTVTLEHFT